MAKMQAMPTKEQMLEGREHALSIDFTHAVLGVDMRELAAGCERIWLAAGCFWGVERLFWQLPGVVNTAVGYAGGSTKNPTYDEVCSGYTGHTEVVQVDFDPKQITLEQLLKVFWEAHDPTQGMRQGNDIGTQYRSAIYGSSEQLQAAVISKALYQKALDDRGLGVITTELAPVQPFYYAEQYHQQYLHKNPNGYCGLKGTGAVCPI